MLPANCVIASATRACSVASASSRSRRAFRAAIFLSRTELRPGGSGESLVGEPQPVERPLAVPFPTGGMFPFLALEPDLTEPELSQLGAARSDGRTEFPTLPRRLRVRQRTRSRGRALRAGQS